MTRQEAQAVLKNWWHQSDVIICQALDAFVKNRDEWLDRHPELLVHPRDLVDERSLGIHQRWDCNVMPFQRIEYHGKKLYVFDFHVEELIS